MRWITGSVVLLCGLMAFSCGGRQPTKDSASSCEDFDLDVKKVWNAEVKLELDMSFKKMGGTIGGRTLEEVSTQMDQVTLNWVMLRQAACKDHFSRGVGTEQEYQSRVACFDDFLKQHRTLIAAIKSEDPEAVLTLLNSDPGTCQ